MNDLDTNYFTNVFFGTVENGCGISGALARNAYLSKEQFIVNNPTMDMISKAALYVLAALMSVHVINCLSTVFTVLGFSDFDEEEVLQIRKELQRKSHSATSKIHTSSTLCKISDRAQLTPQICSRLFLSQTFLSTKCIQA